MLIFAHPVFAIVFGAFVVCAQTCLHFGDLLALSAWTDLPLNDWFAGGFLVYGGVARRRNPTRGRDWEEWQTQLTPSDEFIPAGAFMAILSALLIVSVLALFSTLSTDTG